MVPKHRRGKGITELFGKTVEGVGWFHGKGARAPDPLNFFEKVFLGEGQGAVAPRPPPQPFGFRVTLGLDAPTLAENLIPLRE